MRPQFDTIGLHSYAAVLVNRLKSRVLAVASAVAVALLAAGCVRIDGGAVEVSWVVRSTTGSQITSCSCADPPIDKVRLKLKLVGGPSIQDNNPCDGPAHCDFPCQRQTGSTAFVVKPTQAGESYEISIVAVGVDGSELPGVMSPAPILRSVVEGQPTEVEAFQLVAPCSSECEMNGSGVCARP